MGIISRALDGPRQILLAVDQKIGIEVFKLAVVLSTVYFVQGMGGLSDIPLRFYFKDVLKFSESQLQYFYAITGIAWLIKPLFGFISDRFPIFGYRRKTYMILMALTAAISWWMMALMVYHHYHKYAALVFVFNFSSLGYAFVDVVCDGLMVERGQALKKEDVFVNVQWFALGIAGFIAGLGGGKLQNLVKTGAIPLPLVFIIVGIIPLLTSVIAWIFIKEEKIKKKGAEADNEIVPVKQITNRLNLALIKEFVCSKTFWLLSAFIFFWHYSPSFGAVFQYYEIDILKFDEIFLGKADAIGYAIFPLSILLYAGLLKWFPQIKTKYYLYASIIIGLVYYAVFWLYTVPEQNFNWIKLNLFSNPIISALIFPFLLYILAYIFAWKKRGSSSPTEAKIDSLRRGKFCFGWLIILPLSLWLSLWFSDPNLSPLTLSYRSLRIINNVIFGYATIASFIIPLALAAKLAPTKAEGMTYAYFMALINISKNFLSDTSGAWMFDVLKNNFGQTPILITRADYINLYGIIAVALIALSLIWFIKSRKIKFLRMFPILFLFLGSLILYYTGPFLFDTVKNAAAYCVQQTFLVLKPLLGNAEFLGKEAYRAVILRYFVTIGAIFTLLAVPFVYLLKIPKEKEENN